MAKKKTKKRNYKKAKKIVLGILIAYIVVLAVVYAGGVFYYSGHFYPGSKINGLDSAGKTVEEVERDIEGQIAPMIGNSGAGGQDGKYYSIPNPDEIRK